MLLIPFIVYISGEFSVALILTTSFCNYLSLADGLIPSCIPQTTGFFGQVIYLCKRQKLAPLRQKYKLIWHNSCFTYESLRRLTSPPKQGVCPRTRISSLRALQFLLYAPSSLKQSFRSFPFHVELLQGTFSFPVCHVTVMKIERAEKWVSVL